MTPWTEVARARMPGGETLALRRSGENFEIRCNGWELMSNRAPRSEEAIARLACSDLPDAPRVLIGGLGMGFSLRAALDALPSSACVIVAELVPDIIVWNRGPLAALAGRPLDDARVCVHCGDVVGLLVGRFDAIVLDLDNGPATPIYENTTRLYQRDGLELLRRSLIGAGSLTVAGTLTVWSADRSEAFEAALTESGFTWRASEVSARGDDGPWHVIYLARPDEPERRIT